MRPGLVAVGIAFLVIAGVVLYAVVTLPSGSDARTTRILHAQIPQGSSAAAFVWGFNGSSVALALTWHTDLAVNATLSEPTGCRGGDPSTCAPGTVLVGWSGNTSGAWATAGAPTFPLLLLVHHPGAGIAAMSAAVTATQATVAPFSTWAYVAFLTAGITLGAIGGFALFLGLFLRSGVFRPPSAPPGAPGHPPAY